MAASSSPTTTPTSAAAAELETGFIPALLGDGRPSLILTGLALILSGAFALFLSATGAFLPQDVAFLGMEPRELCGINQCRVVHFMFHDRVAFGGVLLAIGTLYLWLAEFPLRYGEAWAWWAFALSGTAGFASFLCYLGYGYLDTWHGVATLGLLPCFGLGMAKTFPGLPVTLTGWRELVQPGAAWSGEPWRTRFGLGRLCLLGTGLGQLGAGAIIMVVGMTTVFVPEDLKFIGLNAEALRALNPRLLPLIAHDRAGFGGGLFSCGLLVTIIVWKMPVPPVPRALWQALAIAGACGFGCALGVHYPIGYRDSVHLAPAWAGAALFATGLALLARPRLRSRSRRSPIPTHLTSGGSPAGA